MPRKDLIITSSMLESLDRQLTALATLDTTVVRLLSLHWPGPILREKLDQMERLVMALPGDFGELASFWRDKLAEHWRKYGIFCMVDSGNVGGAGQDAVSNKMMVEVSKSLSDGPPGHYWLRPVPPKARPALPNLYNGHRSSSRSIIAASSSAASITMADIEAAFAELSNIDSVDFDRMCRPGNVVDDVKRLLQLMARTYTAIRPMANFVELQARAFELAFGKLSPAMQAAYRELHGQEPLKQLCQLSSYLSPRVATADFEMIKRVRSVVLGKVKTPDLKPQALGSLDDESDDIGPGGDETSPEMGAMISKMPVMPPPPPSPWSSSIATPTTATSIYNRHLPTSSLICHFCHQPGHICPQCPVKDAILCVRCFERGHFDRWCPRFGKRVLYKL